jgi:hypothetical protein
MPPKKASATGTAAL